MELRAGPGNDKRVVARVPPGATLRGRNTHEQWLEVSVPDGTSAWVNLYYLELFPEIVRVTAATRLRRRQAPGVVAEPAALLDFPAADYRVLEARRDSVRAPWFLIENNGVRTWVNRFEVSVQCRFPIVHFVAGLYRYGRQDYRGAEREFMTFLKRGTGDDPVTRATALRFAAASRIANRPTDESKEGRAVAERLLDQSVELTPFDPAAYTARAIVMLGSDDRLNEVFSDLRAASALVPGDPATHALIANLGELSRSGRVSLLLPEQDPRRVADEVHRLEAELER